MLEAREWVLWATRTDRTGRVIAEDLLLRAE
jgi:hypothetical protein